MAVLPAAAVASDLMCADPAMPQALASAAAVDVPLALPADVAVAVDLPAKITFVV